MTFRMGILWLAGFIAFGAAVGLVPRGDDIAPGSVPRAVGFKL
ncbi:hypothetical protein Q4543_17335 [Salipiger sp. 1_MG-2023]|nr:MULTISPECIES: hypothetical protein [Roseobacteraceae]MDO6587279.1 hypothetical protein [Salipiger sp. 1_MG-2023]